MKINNGEEHPGDPNDVVTHTPVGGGSSGTGDGASTGQSGANPPTDDTTATATAITESTPAIVDTTVTPVTTESNTTPAVSFDIGGDLGFDIGGIPDIGGAPTSEVSQTVEPVTGVSSDLGFTTSTEASGETAEKNALTGMTPTIPSQDANSVSFIVGDAGSTEQNEASPVIDIGTVPLTPEEEKAGEALLVPAVSSEATNTTSEVSMTTSPMNTTDNLAGSSIPTESPLTALIGGFSTENITPSTPNTTETMSTPVTETSSPVPTATPDALFGLLGATEEAKAETPTEVVQEAPAVLETSSTEKGSDNISELLTSSGTTPETTVGVKAETPVGVSSLLSASDEAEIDFSGDEDHPMSTVGKELARMTRSPRLQGKLIGFIAGLEELTKEEELLKNEKRKQIESYQARIAELRTEYETRIRALELEEADLKKQIGVMDEERVHLTQVIDGFKKELEVV